MGRFGLRRADRSNTPRADFPRVGLFPRADTNAPPPLFFRHPTTDRFQAFLPPTHPSDVICYVHGQPRSTPETPRRRPSFVVYVRVLIHETHDNAPPLWQRPGHIHDNATSDLV